MILVIKKTTARLDDYLNILREELKDLRKKGIIKEEIPKFI